VSQFGPSRLVGRWLCWVCYLPGKIRMADNIGGDERGIATVVSDQSQILPELFVKFLSMDA
jgi:hypothetical protein